MLRGVEGQAAAAAASSDLGAAAAAAERAEAQPAAAASGGAGSHAAALSAPGRPPLRRDKESECVCELCGCMGVWVVCG